MNGHNGQKKEKVFPIGKTTCYTDNEDWGKMLKEGKYPKTRTAFIRTFQPEEVIKTFLQACQPEAFAYIYHDKDVKEDGTPKEPHYHILVRFPTDDTRLMWIAKAFNGQTTLIQKPISVPTAYAYLTHDGWDKKHQYHESELVTHNSKLLALTKDEQKAEDNAQRLADYENLTLRENALKYGQNFIINHKRIFDFVADMHMEEERLELESLEANITDFSLFEMYGIDPTIYIQERNNELAKYLAKALGELATPCTLDTIRALLLDFNRTEKEERFIWVRRLLRERGEI